MYNLDYYMEEATRGCKILPISGISSNVIISMK